MTHKNLIIVQCRLNSKRLPGKALYPICGIPMLTFLLRRLQCGLNTNDFKIIVATTKLEGDNLVNIWAQEENIEIIKGEENDVLKRFVQCLDCYSANTVVRATADNPLTCPEIIQWLVKERNERNVDYVLCKNLPVGAGVDVFSSDLLRRLDSEAKNADEREHINLYLLRHLQRFNTFFPKAKGKIARPDIRITVDTEDDWENIRALFKKTENEPWKLSIHEAVKRMDNRCI